jgi:hypothetical protein
MKTSKISIWTAPLLAAGAIALSGCGGRSPTNPATISYSQVGVCKTWTTAAGNVEKAKADEGFAVFKIETIDNTKPSDDFHLDPERFYVDQTKAEMKGKNISFQVRRFINPDPRFAQAMGVKPLERASFPGKQKVDVNSFVVIPLAINNPTGGPEADQYSFDLLYDTTTTEQQVGSGGVILTKTEPANTKYTPVESCKVLVNK